MNCFRTSWLLPVAGLIMLSFSTYVMDRFEGLTIAPAGFDKIQFPENNRFSDARWLLGRKLFFDPILSRDSSISCSSCHIPEFAFSDTVSFSLGVDGKLGTRNAPTLTNVAYNTSFTREGGVSTLEKQVLVPIQEHNEFDFNILLIAERMQKDSNYVSLSRDAYNRSPDPFVITRALGCFERTLISGNSRYDQYAYQDKKNALSDEELAGMQLFNSEKTSCSNCHSGFNFTNYSFENNGLYIAYADSGRKRLTNLESDRARFKVPTLRNVALTAPYMHDGSIATLKDVINHYNNGGEPHKNKNKHINKLKLTEREKSNLEAFLLSLTDSSFVSNRVFQPGF